MARALAWHARGRRFDPDTLHNPISKRWDFFMYCIYIIYSTKLDRYYIGYTADVNKRLAEHNTGISTFTSKAADWTIRYTENFTTRELAQKREMEIKRKKSRKYIEWLIQKTS